MKNKHKTIHVKIHDSSAENIFVAINVDNKSSTKQEGNTTRDFWKKLGKETLTAYSQKKTTKTKTGIALAFISSFAITIFAAYCD